jgi:protein-disulfide isomerase
MADKKEKKEEVVTIGAEKLIVPIALILVIIIIALILVFSSKDSSTDGSTSDSSGTEGTTDYGDYADYITDGVSTSIDDDPYIGDKSTATMAIVEFSEYFCSYCYRHTTEVLPDLISEYIDTGKAIYVFRDFQMYGDESEKRAEIGMCVNEVAGGEKFLEYFEKIKSVYFDDGDEDPDIFGIIADLGIDSAAVEECYNSGKYVQEVEDDATDGSALGITGTPAFIVGVLNEDGTVNGSMISGALSLEAFEAVINNLNLE